ncbi:TetR/AcrR family transcriptional regulator [Nocardiopsis sp. CC223A]|uniref:TetR/AcrR family transcriptional regulator n=1 Tax=Nocardiopsis sp. CC223A TaxID=3044051 RepID=UPI00278BED06|nr:TetR family transcriptional regulator C-terminal domain-containing protein [Nocardiopsis sp. CC223A]
MPKLIDHEHRKEEIAESVWRVILREGVAAVSVRTVAAEAGLAVGSVRHVFPSKAELLEFSMALVHERARLRVQRHIGMHDPREIAEAVLHEFLPLDDTRRAEMELDVAIIAEMPAHQGLRTIREKAHQGIRGACHSVLLHLRDTGEVRPEADLELETARLHALVDGLALHGLVDEGDRTVVRDRTVRVLAEHLDSLRPPGQGR